MAIVSVVAGSVVRDTAVADLPTVCIPAIVCVYIAACHRVHDQEVEEEEEERSTLQAAQEQAEAAALANMASGVSEPAASAAAE